MIPALPAESLAERVRRREPSAVARAISLVEDRRASMEPAAIELLRALPVKSGCHRIGITGPPGVGKSSLVSALVKRFRNTGRSVGVLCVDPSSPRSGGALLGDRARIELDADDPDVFVRSMASGGHLGGLARAAGAAVDVLSSAFDVVLIETTGVGQSETDVEHVADTVLLVIQPASGDVLQFIKAGILEIPDVLAVNKADLGPVAERARSELAAALSISAEAGRAHERPPVLAVSATAGTGIDELGSALDQRFSALDARRLTELRTSKACEWALGLFRARHGELGIDAAGGVDALRARLRSAIAAGATAVEAVASTTS